MNQNAEHQWSPQNEHDDKQQAEPAQQLDLPKVKHSTGGDVVCALVLLHAALAEHVCQYLLDVDPLFEE